MISKELNERLTQTGPGTPMGEMLRRYWYPVGTVIELEKEPVQPIRLLGENLTLFRMRNAEFEMGNESGTAEPQPALRSPQPAIRYGLVAERCAHRGLSLAYGVPQENGLRCAYHGWTYDVDGRCVDMPFEPACLPLKIKAYRVEELGGTIWAYLGPEPAPLLPRWEIIVREDVRKSIGFKHLPCNWVQCMDNSMDPVHFEHLHGHYGNYINKKIGRSTMMPTPPHLKIDFDVFEYGIVKRRLIEGQPENCEDWTTGHPVLFPNILLVSSEVGVGFQIRVPMDDTHTMHVTYGWRPGNPDDPSQGKFQVNRLSVQWDDWGRVFAPGVLPQDEMAWIGQSSISDRTQEHLVTSDKGVILYHNLLLENVDKVERGEDPLGVVRDPEKNYPMIALRWEQAARTPYSRSEELTAPS